MWFPSFKRQRYEMRVLMVCAGNICRSPTAEGVLRKKLAGLGLDKRIGVASAGVFPEAGWPPDPRTQTAAMRRGYDLSKIRARGLGADDFTLNDFLFGMDAANVERLNELSPPAHRGKISLLLDAAGRPFGLTEVPDPYYGGPDGFERVLDLIESACQVLAGQLQQRLLQAPPKPLV